MRTIADLLQKVGAANSKGGQDTILAHINPQEAALLKSLGGSGRTDPITGALHFDDDGDSGGPSDSGDGANDSGDGTTSTDSASGSGFGSGWADSGNTQESTYGQYSGQDFANYGWGDPSVGYQSSPQDASDAYAALAQQAYNNWATTPVSEEEFQAQQDANNWAGYNSMGGINSLGDLSSRATSDAAMNEYNSLGWSGLVNGLTFNDLSGKSNVNYGVLGNNIASALGQYGGLVGALTGYGAIGAGISALANLASGKASAGLGTIGGLLGGSGGALAGSILGSLASGKEASALGSLGNYGLNASGLGLGSALAGLGGNAFSAALGGALGSAAQSAAINSALGALGVSNSGSAWGGISTGNATGSSEGDSSYSSGGDSALSGVPGLNVNYIPSSSIGGSSGLSSYLSSLSGGSGSSGNNGLTTTVSSGSYKPLALDMTMMDTGSNLIESDYNTNSGTLGNLLNLASAQNLYGSSYGS